MPPIYEIEAGLSRSKSTKMFPDTQEGYRDALDAGLLHAFMQRIDVDVVQFSPRTEIKYILFRYMWDEYALRSVPVSIPKLAQEKPVSEPEAIFDDPFREYEGCVAG